MKTILFVAAHRVNRSPSQRFRFEQYFNILEAESWNVNFSYLIGESEDQVLYKKGKILSKGLVFLKSILKRMKDISIAKKTTIVFVQREALMTGSIFFEKRFTKYSQLVFDFDDSIWLHDINANQGILNRLKNPNKTAQIIRISKLVIAGNQYLADYASQFNSNVVIIPTTIDTNEYQRIEKQNKPSDKICIGWSGSFSTIKHFETVIPALMEIKAKYGDKVYFKVIGDGSYTHTDLNIQGLDWKKETELEELSEIDIGLMPLPDDEWSKGKCGLKGLQYMALEIATIMSPVGVNTDIIQQGKNGFLAASQNEWVEKISQLIDDNNLRITIGQKGRETVLNDYSVEANKKKYLSAFESLTK